MPYAGNTHGARIEFLALRKEIRVMKRFLLNSLLVTALAGLLAAPLMASTPGVYVNDQFPGATLNTSVWNNISSNSGTGNGTAVVSNGLTLEGDNWNGYGGVTSIAAVHPDAGQTVVFTFNLSENTWEQGKILGLTSGDINANGGAGVYLYNDTNPNYWCLTMSDTAGNRQESTISWASGSINGLIALKWSTNQVTLQHFNTGTGIWTTLFDSTTSAPNVGGSWNIPTTADEHILADVWPASYQLAFTSMELQVTSPYIDDQFNGGALDTSVWTNDSFGGGTAVVSGGDLILTANDYNYGCVMSVPAGTSECGPDCSLDRQHSVHHWE